MSEPKSLQEAVIYYANPDNCLRKMIAKRWPNGVVCPTCGSDKVSFSVSKRIWRCSANHPRKDFSAKVGTIFEDSAIGLDKWLVAVWMISNCKNGISSYELHRALGVTQKTAWFMLHRVRLALQDKDGGMLGGEVEVDETFIGGLSRNMHVSKRKAKITGTGGNDKVPVLGILKRCGKVRTSVVPDVTRKTLHGAVAGNVAPGTQVFTDAWVAYSGLEAQYLHSVIDHAKAYAVENVHTNGLENYWSLLKRTIKGTYVSVEPFHLFRYLDEQAFRYNNRIEMNDADRFELAMYQIAGKRLTYKGLTGKAPETETLTN
ncbi:MAG: IS1595 family transposase [Terriglobia bacterium]